MPPKRKAVSVYTMNGKTFAKVEHKSDLTAIPEGDDDAAAVAAAEDAARAIAKRPAPIIELSREQRDVVRDIVLQKNVLVIAKAGSGKSSVALAAAQRYFDQFQERTLLITYNTRLKDETRARIKRLSLEHAVEAHSYHAVASKFFVPRKEGGTADNALIHEATKTEKPLLKMEFGLVIIDEAQDMNALYADFVKHLLQVNGRKPVMMLVGDPFQRIFGFNGASCDFMIYPRKNFGALCREDAFATHHLSVCWRITHEMAKFINAHLNPCNLKYSVSPEWWLENGEKITAWWGRGIRANPKRKAAPDSCKIVRGWGSREIVQETQKLFDAYGNDEVALLAFSLKGDRTPIRAIVNQMGQNSHENWAVLAGTSTSSGDVLTGKRLASTIHRMKGLERRGIVVCGMDAFIEKIYTNDPLEHFNIFYVACTRAKDRLIINATGVDYATLRCTMLSDTDKAKQSCEVPALVGYVPFDHILSVPENLFDARVELMFPEKALALDRQACLVEGRAAGTVEDLSPFMSRAISFKLMLMIQGKLFRIPVDHDSAAYDRSMVDFIHQFYEQIEALPSSVTWPSLVKYSVAYETLKSKYKHLWRQLTDYDAFTPTALLEKCTTNAFNLLWTLAQRQGLVTAPSGQDLWAEGPGTAERAQQLRALVDFEVPLAVPFYPEWFLKTYVGQISGVADMIFNKNTVVGVECSDSVSAERGLELSLYESMRYLVQPEREPQAAAAASKIVMILTNTAQLVSVNLKLAPLHDKVPLQYELLHRTARRKLQLEPMNKDELWRDFQGKPDKKRPLAGKGHSPRWMNLFD